MGGVAGGGGRCLPHRTELPVQGEPEGCFTGMLRELSAGAPSFIPSGCGLPLTQSAIKIPFSRSAVRGNSWEVLMK